MAADGMHFTSEFRNPDADFYMSEHGMLAMIETEVQTWLDNPVGRFDTPLCPADKVTMALQGSPVADFFNQVQLEATGAQISCTSLANQVRGFGCAVSIRDIIANYPYADALRVLEVTGEVLRAALERSASYLDIGPDGMPVVASHFLLPKVEHYNYDYFANLTYTADLRNPAGSRILSMQYGGREIMPADKFSVCMTHYRATGTGGYDAYRTCPILHEGQVEVSQLLQEYLANRDVVKIACQPAPKFIY